MVFSIGARLCAGILFLASIATDVAAADAVQRADLEKAAGVDSGGLVMYASASFASAHGGRVNVDFASGVYAQSATRIHLLSYDRVSKSFRQDISFEISTIPGVALVASKLGRKQLQIKTESGLVACDFGKIIDDGRVATQVYERLIASGVRIFESPGLIRSFQVPGPTVITIYLPSR